MRFAMVVVAEVALAVVVVVVVPISQDDSQLINSSISVESEKALRTYGPTDGRTHSLVEMRGCF